MVAHDPAVVMVEKLPSEVDWMSFHQLEDLPDGPRGRTRPELLPILRSNSPVQQSVDHRVSLRVLDHSVGIAMSLKSRPASQQAPQLLQACFLTCVRSKPAIVGSEVRAVCLQPGQNLPVDTLRSRSVGRNGHRWLRWSLIDFWSWWLFAC